MSRGMLVNVERERLVLPFAFMYEGRQCCQFCTGDPAQRVLF